MELRQLRTFVAVAELRHFARAASLCNLSQPAVSHQIALLEGEVGAKLLNRAARRVSLTVAGEVLLAEERRILGAFHRAREPNQLDAETWLLREEGSDTRRQTVMWWHRHRVAPSRTMTFDNPDAVKRAVMAGLGAAMVSRLTVAEDLSSRRVAVVSIKTGLP